MESSLTFTPLIRLPLYCVHFEVSLTKAQADIFLYKEPFMWPSLYCVLFKVSLTKAQAVIFLCKEPFMWPSLYCVHFKVSLTKAQSVIFLCEEPFMRSDFCGRNSDWINEVRCFPWLHLGKRQQSG